MSKSNSLLNYFKKVDTPTKNSPVIKENKENEITMNEEEPKAKRSLDLRDSSESPPPVNNKRRRVMILADSDNSDDECKKKPLKEIKEEKYVPTTPNNKIISKKLENSSSKIKTEKIKKENDSNVSSPSSKDKVKVNLSEFAANDDQDSNDPSETMEGKFKHLNYEFLFEHKIKDINGRLKLDPDYDSRTLYVPDEFLKSVTPAIRQWWELKKNNFDVILFFKVGKFYELYHQDAVIAVKELGLTFMKGDYAHCGFPEIAYTRFADALISKGYKVGRVEQTETPDMMNERLKNTKHTKFDKTVRREVCRITTPGTKTPEIMDNEFTSSTGSYLFSIIEKVHHEKNSKSFGVCFLETTVGRLYIGQFDDDRHCSKLRTTLAKYVPGHILYEKNNISKETKHILDLQSALLESLASNEQMMNASKLLRTLLEGDYFKTGEDFKWPESFQTLLSDTDSLGLTPKPEYELALHAMGGVLWCLKKCLIDLEILSMKNIEIYSPEDNRIIKDEEFIEKKKTLNQKYMVLDAITLNNLEVIRNSSDGSTSGTLFERLDYCNTPFGKRLLKTWLVNPLCDKNAINDRLDAIEDFLTIVDKISIFGSTLKSLPDLERLISKIHNIGNVPKDHPESRAIYFENDIYSKKKVEDLVTTLNGLSTAARFFDDLAECSKNFKSNLLKSISKIVKTDENQTETNGFPYLHDLLKYYKTTFDAEKAKKEGKITPTPGINEDYDVAVSDIKSTEHQLEIYLSKQKKEIGCSTISYFGTAKNRYQLEIPESKCKNLSEDYELTSSKKGFKRFWTEEIKELLAQLTDAEDRKEQALRNTLKCLFKNFDNHYKVWSRAVQSLAIVDVLISFSMYVNNSTSQTCRPKLIDSNNEEPFIEIVNGLHPSLSKTFSGDFIPNDIVIGNKNSNEQWRQRPLLLVTGPNMGGKSTLMRQAGLSLILTQIGCYVPAESCSVTPVDRIFTRIGASDKILAGESTFFLELSETASILHNATKHSLVLIDELGRGTATYDGVAIAYSVIRELANKIKCLTLFSTHYHHLVEEFLNNDNVSLGHMKCLVEKDANSGKELITFLYKFDEGACPKSHGFNAAHLADIPDEIIKLGSKKSEEFESFTKRVQVLKDILTFKNKSSILNALQKIQIS